MEPTGTPGGQLYRDEVLAARVMTPEEKLLAGPQLFDFACRIALDGIRHQFPDADEQRIRQVLTERVELGRRLENASCRQAREAVWDERRAGVIITRAAAKCRVRWLVVDWKSRNGC